jgi:hypothetical protein
VAESMSTVHKSIRLSEFRQLNEAEKAAALRELAVASHGEPNGELTVLEARIRACEVRYELTSDQMRMRVAEGVLPETAEIASWLIALEIQERLRSTKARSGSG